MSAAVPDRCEPSTPDHYCYDWAVPDSAVVDGGFVRVTWPDGVVLDAYSLWLFENDVERALEPVSRECVITPSTLPDPSILTSASVNDDGAVAVVWANGTESTYHPGWLRHVADGDHLPEAPLPTREVWTTDTMVAPPTVELTEPLGTDAAATAVGEWLNNMARYGLCRLRGIGTDLDALEALMAYVGPIRGSNFGNVFTVEANITPDSTANTGLELNSHTDLPTRETPPGFQFLHCVRNEVSGGWSYMADGLAVIGHLQREFPDDYASLTTHNWVWFNRQLGEDHRWVGPVIDHGADQSPVTIRAFYPVRSFPAMDPSEMPAAYRALQRFHQIADDPAFRLAFPFEPGDVIGFDNRQILHGRSAFDGGGRRLLRGCYVDRDDVRSRQRSRARTQGPTEPNTPPSKEQHS